MGAVNPYLIKAGTTVATGLAGISSNSKLGKSIQKQAERQTKNLKINEQSQLEAMSRNYAQSLMDQNLDYITKTNAVNSSVASTQSQVEMSTIGMGVDLAGSSYYQDMKNEIDAQYTQNMMVLSNETQENTRRLQEMNTEQRENVMRGYLQQEVNIRMGVVDSYEQIKTQNTQALIASAGAIGSYVVDEYYQQGSTGGNE